MNDKAKQFYDRSLTAETYSQKLLCLYNAFFCLYGSEASKQASAICNSCEEEFNAAVEYAREDSESKRVVLSESQIALLKNHLLTVLK